MKLTVISWNYSKFPKLQELNYHQQHVDVSQNRGTPKWMVKIMENPIKMDDLGGFPIFLAWHPYKNHSFWEKAKNHQ